MRNNFFPVSELPKRLQPVLGKRLHPSTAERWMRKGVQGIRLRVRYMGGRPFTCDEWVDEFFDRQTELRQGTAPAVVTSAACADSQLRQ